MDEKQEWVEHGEGQIHASGAYIEQDDEDGDKWWAFPHKWCGTPVQCKTEEEAKNIAVHARENATDEERDEFEELNKENEIDTDIEKNVTKLLIHRGWRVNDQNLWENPEVDNEDDPNGYPFEKAFAIAVLSEVAHDRLAGFRKKAPRLVPRAD
jgi:hypothetical protein